MPEGIILINKRSQLNKKKIYIYNTHTHTDREEHIDAEAKDLKVRLWTSQADGSERKTSLRS